MLKSPKKSVVMENNSVNKYSKVCRTCLIKIGDSCNFSCLNSTDSSTETITVRDKLEEFVPELDLLVTPDAVVCSDCSATIDSAYRFKKRCLEIQGSIKSVVQVPEKKQDSIPYEPHLKLEFEVAEECKNNGADWSTYVFKEEYFRMEPRLECVEDSDRDKPTACNYAQDDPKETIGEQKVSGQHDKRAKGEKLHKDSNDSAVNHENKSEKSVKHSKQVKESHNQCSVGTPRLKIRTGIKLYKCSECEYMSRRKRGLNVHTMKVHTGERPFKCTECDYRCIQKYYLKIHMKIHTGEKSLKCDKCSYETNFRGELTNHMHVHTGEKLYKCKICDLGFVKMYNLKRHLKTHTGEKPFKCTYCDHRTTEAGQLKIHIRTHTGEKPYKCDVCNYRATYRTGLVRHMNSHSENKPFKCTECGYSTAQLQGLEIHRRSHTREKSCKCTDCDYCCTQLSTLKVHIKKHNKKTDASV